MSVRNTIVEQNSQIVKQFTYREHYDREVAAYRDYAWAAPRLLVVDDLNMTITVERLPTAEQLKWWKPTAQLFRLLDRLHHFGVNHCDVHVGNIVCDTHRGPLLIDWELHTRNINRLSYDLYGPERSGVPQPEGQRGPAMWVGAKHPRSVGVAWAT